MAWSFCIQYVSGPYADADYPQTVIRSGLFDEYIDCYEEMCMIGNQMEEELTFHVLSLTVLENNKKVWEELDNIEKCRRNIVKLTKKYVQFDAKTSQPWQFKLCCQESDGRCFVNITSSAFYSPYDANSGCAHLAQLLQKAGWKFSKIDVGCIAHTAFIRYGVRQEIKSYCYHHSYFDLDILQTTEDADRVLKELDTYFGPVTRQECKKYRYMYSEKHCLLDHL